MKRFDPDTFAILGVNTDTDREQYRTLRGELGVTWPSLWQGGRKGAYIDAWKPSAYPTTILVDADGTAQAMAGLLPLTTRFDRRRLQLGVDGAS